MTIQEEAVKLHGEGLNCAQCVLASCGKYTGLDAETARKIAAGFGGGVRSGEICGAISGAVMALGMAADTSAEASALARQCVGAFREKYGCVRCLELKSNRTSCDELIAFGAQTAEQMILSK